MTEVQKNFEVVKPVIDYLYVENCNYDSVLLKERIKIKFFNGYFYLNNNTDFFFEEDNTNKLLLVGCCQHKFDKTKNEVFFIKKVSEEVDIRSIIGEVKNYFGLFSLFLVIKGEMFIINDFYLNQTCCYGVINGNLCISNSAETIGKFYNLKISDTFKELSKFKSWKKATAHIVSDNTQFDLVKRLPLNTYLNIKDNFNLTVKSI